MQDNTNAVIRIIYKWNDYRKIEYIKQDVNYTEWDNKIYELINELLPLVDNSCVATNAIRMLLRDSKYGWIDATGSDIYIGSNKAIKGSEWTYNYECGSPYCMEP
jgi:hypothetical protein